MNNELKPLSPRELKFITEYFKTGRKKESAISAGYSPAGAASHATRILQKPHISAKLEKMKKEVETETILTKKFVLESWKKIIESSIQMVKDEKVFISKKNGVICHYTLGKDGEEVWRPLNSAIALTALRDLARHLGMFEKDPNEQEGTPKAAMLMNIPPSQFSNPEIIAALKLKKRFDELKRRKSMKKKDGSSSVTTLEQ